MTGSTVFAIAPCLGCNRVFSFNPMRVPTVILGGAPMAVCRSCLDRVNLCRSQIGLPEIPAEPGAYEPTSEDEA